MRRRPLFRVLAATVLILLTLIAPNTALPAAAQAPAPPNDTFGRALPLTIGATAQGQIQPRGNADWYQILVDRPGELQVKISDVAPELAVNFRLWNANKDAVSDWIAPLARGGETAGFVDLAEPGRYYIEVRDGGDTAESAQPYTLSTSFAPIGDPSEPNNAFGRPTQLVFDTPLQANILPRGDADWYLIEIEKPGELQLSATNVPSDLDIVYRVWNSNRDAISDFFAPLAKGGDTAGFVDLPTAGRYYIEVHDGSDDLRSAQSYTFAVRFTPAADVFEPNNSFGAVAPLTLGQSISATILPANDADWYGFTVDKHGELKLKISGVDPEMAVFMRIWNANRDTLTDWFRPLAKGGDTEATVDLPAPGRYALEVTADYGQRAIQPYNLRADFTPAVDAQEPNNSFAHAADLGLDRSLQANILPAEDRDWYYFDLAQPGEVTIRATQVSPDLAVFIRYWNANKDTLTDWFRPLAKGGDTEGRIDLVEPGRYYLEVAGDSGQRSIQPFVLALDYVPAVDANEPNGSFETAKPVQLDTNIAGYLFPADDRDWYRIDIPAEGEAAAISITQAGTYYVELAGSDYGARSSQPYVLRLSMQEIDPAEVTVPGAAGAPTPTDAGTTAPLTSTTPVTASTPFSPAGKVTILTSGHVGPMGAEIFVLAPDKPDVSGARLEVPPGAVAELQTVDVGVTSVAPADAPFGLQPAGAYWSLTPNGLKFKQPVTITLPVPTGAAGAQMFIGHWDGKQWIDLGGTVENGLITAVTDGFSEFGVFCGRLEDYSEVLLENASGSPYINLTYVSGPNPDPDNPDAFAAGCPLPYDGSQTWELKQGAMEPMLLRPGVYHFIVAYPQPQPGVANGMFVTIAPGGGRQSIKIQDDGATSDNPDTKINFAGRNVAAGSNVAPTILCNAVPPAGVTLTNGDPSATALPSRVVLASQLKLEQMPPKGPGIQLGAVATDPEGSEIRTYWTGTGGLGGTTAGDPVASGATIQDQYTFKPTLAGDYTVFLTVYDNLGLFAECRWVLNVEANEKPVIKVFSGRTSVEFGRLDEERSEGVGPVLPATTVLRPGVTAPVAVPAAVAGNPAVSWDGLTLCPTALAGPFATLPDINTVVTQPAPVDVLNTGGAAAGDTTNRWQFPGRTCVWALVADPDADPLTVTWEFPGPIYGSGTFYAAVTVPAGFHSSAQNGITTGALMKTNEALAAYSAWVSALYNLTGAPPAVVWEAWDDPCPPGTGAVANPCPSGVSRGGVENIVANVTDGFSLPAQTGYAPIAVGPEAVEAGTCDGVFFISSLTPSPSDPGAGEGVRVTARVSPITEGCLMNMSIVGTDSYRQQNNIATNKSGEAEMFIPGGAEGVVDVVTARFCSPVGETESVPTAEACTTASNRPGRWVVMEVNYTF
ncbi:MAG: PPC domain-containing protein [Anaerolineales bacterium]|nr:PPC domain-containing protein [Anaerolineales bacterium]